MLWQNRRCEHVLHEVGVLCRKVELYLVRSSDCDIVLSSDDTLHEGFDRGPESIILDEVESELYIGSIKATDTVLPGYPWADIHGPCLVIRGKTPSGRRRSTSSQGRNHSLEDRVIPQRQRGEYLAGDSYVVV